MEIITIQLTGFAHGGAAVGRGKRGVTLFVPYGIAGETVRAKIHTQKRGYARAEIVEILRPSPNRVEPRCAHFGVCGGCHFQHLRYQAQLQAKQSVVEDQLRRVGGFKQVNVQATLPNPAPWAYRLEMPLSPAPGGGLGFWSPVKQQVIPVQECPITDPRLVELLSDVDLDLPGLRKLTLRLGDDEALLAAIEVDDVEPPLLAADFPISVAIVLPDNTAASLVGDNYVVQAVKGRDFRVSPGCFFQPSAAAAALIVECVMQYAALSGQETVLELYSGVGVLTAFLAERAVQLLAVEQNPDAVADSAVNLDHLDNVTLYEGVVEEILPMLNLKADVMVIDPPESGLSQAAVQAITAKAAPRLVYVSADPAALARDGKQLKQSGYRLAEVQPIDARPQTFHVDTVSLWQKDVRRET